MTFLPYQITFFSQQDDMHHGKPLGRWVLLLATELDLPGATMIVVGHRSHGLMGHRLLGSVAKQVMRHATCDVLVVR